MDPTVPQPGWSLTMKMLGLEKCLMQYSKCKLSSKPSTAKKKKKKVETLTVLGWWSKETVLEDRNPKAKCGKSPQVLREAPSSLFQLLEASGVSWFVAALLQSLPLPPPGYPLCLPLAFSPCTVTFLRGREVESESSPGWPRTHNSPVSPSQVMGLHAHHTWPHLLFIKHQLC
jgi:hypothetical protein